MQRWDFSSRISDTNTRTHPQEDPKIKARVYQSLCNQFLYLLQAQFCLCALSSSRRTCAARSTTPTNVPERPGLDKIGDIHRHLVDLCCVVLLNITQDLNIVLSNKIDCNTLATEAPRTTDTRNNIKISAQRRVRIRRKIEWIVTKTPPERYEIGGITDGCSFHDCLGDHS